MKKDNNLTTEEIVIGGARTTQPFGGTKSKRNSKKTKVATSVAAVLVAATAVIGVPVAIKLTEGSRGYTVTIQGMTSTESIHVKKGAMVGDVNAPKIPGYYFVGYCSDAELTQRISPNTQIKEDTTIYLQYVAIEYRFQNLANGVAIKYDGETYQTDQTPTLNYGAQFEVSYTLPRGNHVSNFSVSGVEMVEDQGSYKEEGNTVYSAKYQVVGYGLDDEREVELKVDYAYAINEYSIKFVNQKVNDNGVTEHTIVGNNIVEFNNTISFSKSSSLKNYDLDLENLQNYSNKTYHYYFKGWSTNPYADGNDFTQLIDFDTFKVTDENTDEDGNLTLYAIYTSEYVEYSINLNYAWPTECIKIFKKGADGVWGDTEILHSDTLHYGDEVYVVFTESDEGHTMEYGRIVGGAVRTGERYNNHDVYSITNDLEIEYNETINTYTILNKPAGVVIRKQIDGVWQDVESRAVVEYGLIEIGYRVKQGHSLENFEVSGAYRVLDEQGNELPATVVYNEEDGSTTTTYKYIINKNLRVTYSQVINKYTVTFYDYDGSEIRKDTNVNWDSRVFAPTGLTRQQNAAYTYNFVGWVDKEGNEVSSFANIRQDITVYANYEAIAREYSINIPTGVQIYFAGAGNIASEYEIDEQLTSQSKLHYGDVITLTFSSQAGYQLSKFTAFNLDVISSSGQGTESGTLTGVVVGSRELNEGDVEISFEQVVKTYFISVSAPKGADIVITDDSGKTYANGSEVKHFTSLTITYTADQGYYISNFRVNDNEYSYTGDEEYETALYYTIVVGENVEIYCEQDVEEYEINISSTNGTITITDNEGNVYANGSKVKHFTTLNVDFLTKEGYHISNFSVNDQNYAYSEEDGYVSTITLSEAVAGEVSIVAEAEINTYVVTFKDYDGTVLSSVEVDYNQTASFDGVPERVADETFTYEFTNWVTQRNGAVNATLSNIVADTEVYANYKATYINYVVSYFDGDGNKLWETSTAHYGDNISFKFNNALSSGLTELPTKTSTQDEVYVYNYTFTNWSETTVNSNNLVVNAIFEQNAVYRNYTVVYYLSADENNTSDVVVVRTAHYNDDIAKIYTGEEPVQDTWQDNYNIYSYSFVGWEQSAVTGDMMVRPVFKESVKAREYNITFLNGDGEILTTTSAHYDDEISTVFANSGSSIPTKADTFDDTDTYRYTYLFMGWNETQVNGHMTIVPIFEQVEGYVYHDVTFYNGDGSVLATTQANNGTNIESLFESLSVAGPYKETEIDDTFNHTYTFVGWDKAIVYGATIVTPKFETDTRYNEYTFNLPANVWVTYITGSSDYAQNSRLEASSILHYGDVVRINYKVDVGYDLDTFAVLNFDQTSDTSAPANAEEGFVIGNVVGNFEITFKQAIKQYTLELSTNSTSGAVITVTDGLGNALHNGDVISHFTKVVVSYQISDASHHISELTIDGVGYMFDELSLEQDRFSQSLVEEYSLEDYIYGNTISIVCNEEVNTYYIIYKNAEEDGGETFLTSYVEHGGLDFYWGEVPTREETVYNYYNFQNWIDENGNEVNFENITEDKVVYATYATTYKEYAIDIPQGVEIYYLSGSSEYEAYERLNAGSTLHAGDTVKISYTASRGHEMSIFNVQNLQIASHTGTEAGDTSGSIIGVVVGSLLGTEEGNLVINFEEVWTQYYLSLPVGIGLSEVEVVYVSGSSDYQQGQQLSMDDTLHLDDEITITFKCEPGRKIVSIEALGLTTTETSNTEAGSTQGYITGIVNENVDIIYEEEFIDYTITFVNEFGSTLFETIAHYGDSVNYIYSGAVPTKESWQDDTFIHNYAFASWSIVEVTGDAVVYPEYTETLVYREYELTWQASQVSVVYISGSSAYTDGQELTAENTLHFGDIVKISYTNEEGKCMESFIVDGVEVSTSTGMVSGSLVGSVQGAVRGNISIDYADDFITYTIVELPATVSITYISGTSNYEHGEVLSLGSSIKYGDRIAISYYSDIGTIMKSFTYSGVNDVVSYDVEQGNTFGYIECTVGGSVAVGYEFDYIEYQISSVPSQITITYMGGTSQYEEGTVLYLNGEAQTETQTYHYGDILKIEYTSSTGKHITDFFANGLTTTQHEGCTQGSKTGYRQGIAMGNIFIDYVEEWDSYSFEGLPAGVRIIYLSGSSNYEAGKVLETGDTLHYGDNVRVEYNSTNAKKFRMLTFEVAGMEITNSGGSLEEANDAINGWYEGSVSITNAEEFISVIYTQDYIDYSITSIAEHTHIYYVGGSSAYETNQELTASDLLHYDDVIRISYESSDPKIFRMKTFNVYGMTKSVKNNTTPSNDATEGYFQGSVTGEVSSTYTEDYKVYYINFNQMPEGLTITYLSGTSGYSANLNLNEYANSPSVDSKTITLHYGDEIRVEYNSTHSLKMRMATFNVGGLNITNSGGSLEAENDALNGWYQGTVENILTFNYSEDYIDYTFNAVPNTVIYYIDGSNDYEYYHELQVGDTLHYDDIIQVNYQSSDVNMFRMTEFDVEEVERMSWENITPSNTSTNGYIIGRVLGNINTIYSEDYRIYTLDVASIPAGVSITYVSGECYQLGQVLDQQNNTVFNFHYGDVIKVEYNSTDSNKYRMLNFSTNGLFVFDQGGSTEESNDALTGWYQGSVQGDVSIIYNQAFIDYSIGTIPTGVTITFISGEGSSHAPGKVLSADDKLHYGDKIRVEYNSTDSYTYRMKIFNVYGLDESSLVGEGLTPANDAVYGWYEGSVSGSLQAGVNDRAVMVEYEQDYIAYTIGKIPAGITVYYVDGSSDLSTTVPLSSSNTLHYGDRVRVEYHSTNYNKLRLKSFSVNGLDEGTLISEGLTPGNDATEGWCEGTLTGNLTFGCEEELREFVIETIPTGVTIVFISGENSSHTPNKVLQAGDTLHCDDIIKIEYTSTNSDMYRMSNFDYYGIYETSRGGSLIAGNEALTGYYQGRVAGTGKIGAVYTEEYIEYSIEYSFPKTKNANDANYVKIYYVSGSSDLSTTEPLSSSTKLHYDDIVKVIYNIGSDSTTWHMENFSITGFEQASKDGSGGSLTNANNAFSGWYQGKVKGTKVDDVNDRILKIEFVSNYVEYSIGDYNTNRITITYLSGTSDYSKNTNLNLLFANPNVNNNSITLHYGDEIKVSYTSSNVDKFRMGSFSVEGITTTASEKVGKNDNEATSGFYQGIVKNNISATYTEDYIDYELSLDVKILEYVTVSINDTDLDLSQKNKFHYGDKIRISYKTDGHQYCMSVFDYTGMQKASSNGSGGKLSAANDAVSGWYEGSVVGNGVNNRIVTITARFALIQYKLGEIPNGVTVKLVGDSGQETRLYKDNIIHYNDVIKVEYNSTDTLRYVMETFSIDGFTQLTPENNLNKGGELSTSNTAQSGWRKGKVTPKNIGDKVTITYKEKDKTYKPFSSLSSIPTGVTITFVQAGNKNISKTPSYTANTNLGINAVLRYDDVVKIAYNAGEFYQKNSFTVSGNALASTSSSDDTISSGYIQGSVTDKLITGISFNVKYISKTLVNSYSPNIKINVVSACPKSSIHISGETATSVKNNISSGTTLHVGDKITISHTSTTGYRLKTLKVTGIGQGSPVATKDIDITTTNNQDITSYPLDEYTVINKVNVSEYSEKKRSIYVELYDFEGGTLLKSGNFDYDTDINTGIKHCNTVWDRRTIKKNGLYYPQKRNGLSWTSTKVPNATGVCKIYIKTWNEWQSDGSPYEPSGC